MIQKSFNLALLGAAAVFTVVLESGIGDLFFKPFFNVIPTTAILWVMGPIAGLFAFTTFLRATLSQYQNFRPKWPEVAWISNGLAFFTSLNLLHFGLLEAGFSYGTTLSSTFSLTIMWAVVYENFDLIKKLPKLAELAKVQLKSMWNGDNSTQPKPSNQPSPNLSDDASFQQGLDSRSNEHSSSFEEKRPSPLIVSREQSSQPKAIEQETLSSAKTDIDGPRRSPRHNK